MGRIQSSVVGDSLRIRIAQTIYGDGNTVPWPTALSLSDLIIWDLGLRLDVAYAWTGSTSIKTGNRYVTDWQPEERGGHEV